jgi:hypothetical protein
MCNICHGEQLRAHLKDHLREVIEEHQSRLRIRRNPLLSSTQPIDEIVAHFYRKKPIS